MVNLKGEILKALIKSSKVRAILLSPNHQFYVPGYLVEEVEKHISLIREKTGLSEDEIKLALNILPTKLFNRIVAKSNEGCG